MDVTKLSAVELAARIRSREVSSVDVVEEVLRLADDLDDTVNAFITLDADNAKQAAAEADEQVVRGDALGRLHGVPFTVKDLLPTAGLRTTYGSQAFADHLPDRDAIAVARARAAGGILIGKTATPELAASLQTSSRLNGITRNPWSLDHSAGGSSGGAGAAVAAGIAPLALSTDGAGSSRVPASVCGVMGLKPTLGRVPHEAWPFHFSNNSSVSVNTRTPGDAALLLEVVQGSSRSDPWAARPATPEVEPSATPSLLFIQHPCGRAPDAEILAAVSRALSDLANAGARVELADGDPTDFDPAMVPGILAPNLAARVRSMTEEQQALLDTPLQQLASPEYCPDAVALQQLEIERSLLYDRVDQILGVHDMIVTPTVLSDPPSAEAVIDADWWTHLAVANFTGHPAVSIPCGFTEAGLPIGLQVVGRWDADLHLLDLADRLHSLNPWSHAWPR